MVLLQSHDDSNEKRKKMKQYYHKENVKNRQRDYDEYKWERESETKNEEDEKFWVLRNERFSRLKRPLKAWRRKA